MHTHRMLLSFLAVYLLLFVVSCDHEDPIRSQPRPDDEVVGRWAWVSTFDPWTATTITPAQAGYTQELALRQDGSFVLTQSGIVVETGSYSLDRESEPLRVRLPGRSFELRGDELVHDETPVDGPRIVFRWVGPLLVSIPLPAPAPARGPRS